MKTLVQSKKGDKMQIRANQPAPLVALGYWQHGPKSCHSRCLSPAYLHAEFIELCPDCQHWRR